MNVQGELQNWLVQTGKDIGKAVGSHIKEKGVSYAKQQLGLGLDAEMNGKRLGHSGDGMSVWLKESGKQIAKAVGKHLQDEFKDMAVSKAKEFLGNGISDEMKKHATAAAKSAGKAAMTTAVSKAGSIKDLTTAKSVATDIGSAAALAGQNHLTDLAKKNFGGAGTPEIGARACAYTLTELRKIITLFRRDLSEKSVNEFLDMHAHRVMGSDTIQVDDEVGINNRRGNKHVADYRQRLHLKPSKGGILMKKKRQHVSALRKALHPPVSGLSRKMAVEYIFGVARELGVNWEPFFMNAKVRKRIPKNCYKLSGPQGNASEQDVAAYPKIAKVKRKPSAYNLFMKQRLKELKTKPMYKTFPQKGLFKIAAGEWKSHKQNLDTDAAESLLSLDRAKRFQSAPFNKKKVPKKRKSEPELTEAQQNAQLASMGLPTSFV